MPYISGGGGGGAPTGAAGGSLSGTYPNPTVASLQSGAVVLTSGNLTTTSATFVDATGLTVTLTTGAHRCLVTFSGTCANNGTSAVMSFDVAVDGTRQGGTLGLFDINASTANNDCNGSFSFVTAALSAASHTIKLQYRSNGTQTVTIFASATSPACFSVVELFA